MKVRIVVAFAFAILIASEAHAWNALGHKVIAEIAWHRLKPAEREKIVDILRRHPRFDQDFARDMSNDRLVTDKESADRWIFQHAATWPDIARRTDFDRPKWHYVDFPLYLDESDRIALADRMTVNLRTDYKKEKDRYYLNVLQSIDYSRDTIKSDGSVENKALAYCWLFHLVGDLHQPLHSTSLFCVTHFPSGEGDRGGNEIPIRGGRNLHSLWDGLLGRRYFMGDVDKEVALLTGQYRDVWKTASVDLNQRKWADEGHEVCKSAVYSDEILNAVRSTPQGSRIEPIELPKSYYEKAGEVARQRIISAGVRLAAILQQPRSD